MATSDRGLRVLARVQLALAILFAVSFVIAVFAARTSYPYRDDWDWLAWRLGGPLNLHRLLIPHNEHVPLLPRLIFVLQFWIEKSRNDVMVVAAIVELLIVTALILNEARRHVWPSRVERGIAIGVGAPLLFFSWQLQSMLFATTIAFPLVEMLTVIAIVCVVNATSTLTSGRGWLAGAIGAAVAAMATTSAGMLVPMVLAVVAFCRRARPAIVATFALVFVAGLVGYFLIRPSHDPSIPPGSIGQVIALFFSFFASLAAYRSAVLGVALGAMMVGAGLVVLWPALRRSPAASRLDHVAAGIAVFTMATALATASARAGFGAEQGAQSRYATFVLPYWCAVWLVVWDRVCRSDRLLARRAIAAIALLITLALFPLHLLTAAVWRAKSDNVSVASLALRSGVEDEGWIHTLHPNAAVVTDSSTRLRAIGDSAFQLPAIDVRADDVRAMTACPSAFLALPLTKSGDYELRSSLETAGDRGVVLDGQGRLIGLARVAPLVASTEPSHGDVIAAVLRALRHQKRMNWLGFAHSSGGPPAMVIIERETTPVCRASIMAS